MPDEVWPLARGEGVWLRTIYGIGCEMKGFTRPDASGRYFGTRWVTFVLMPVIPLDRFYLEEVSSGGVSVGVYSEWRTRYKIAGRARLHFGEILRTLIFGWLVAPAVVLVPNMILLSRANDLNVWLVLGGFMGWLIGSIVVLELVLTWYRLHWAPVRTVRWATS
jgi:hypothetical protein